MIKRKIIHINEDKCDGCGLCIPHCHEGALQIINGKARLVRENYCDGLGACLGQCPQGALSIIEAEVAEFDETAVNNHVKEKIPDTVRPVKHEVSVRNEPEHGPHYVHKNSGCPSSRTMVFNCGNAASGETNSKLKQWPIQLHLVPPFAPFYANADLYLIADCVPFTYPDFHNEFLNNHAIAIACPKLDNIQPYVQKIANIIKASSVKSITAVVMEVPCCSGLVQITREAIRLSGVDVPFEVIVVGIEGNILKKIAI